MRRPIYTWIIFGLCLAVMLAAMAWISLAVLRLDREAAVEENVRLALWRMESALAPVIAQESARPYFSYSAFYPAERTYTRMFAEIGRGEVLEPSPLLTQVSPYILLHFQFDSDGKLTSPQVPTANRQDLAEAAYTTHENIEASAARLAKLATTFDREKLLGLLPPEKPPPMEPVRFAAMAQVEPAPANLNEQYIRNVKEWQARASNQMFLQSNVDNSLLPRPFGIREGTMTPLWVGPALVLARRVSINGQEYVQGCWLDWPAIRQWLTASVKDLFPAARLDPAGSGPGDERGRMLAALPVRLVTGLIPAKLARGISPIRLSLVVAWSCVVLAAMAVAVLLLGALSLSERRGAFVSAVTHELRTPLTTLRMYTEMLTEGMVPEKEKIRRYINTLRVEADRLGHLVENVLAYARLEGRRTGTRLETVTLREMLDRVEERLAQRAAQAGMNLVVEPQNEIQSASTRADTSAVEHILFNLVDNACKYAASGSDRRIHLEAGREGNFVSLFVRDHGPGIPAADARCLFRPFHKSARDAANRAPGIGLGLALSRRLAHSMGGDLQLDESVMDGACFVLTLPGDSSPDLGD